MRGWVLAAACAITTGAVGLAAGAAGQQAAAKPATAQAAAPAKLGPGTYLVFNTSKGTFVAQLYVKEAPKTTQLILELAQGKRPYRDPLSGTLSMAKFYDGLLFYRTAPDELIQTGDALNNGQGNIGINAPAEKNSLKFDQPGRMGMAQVGDNANTRSSSFFFAFAPDPALNANYLVVGQIVEGMDVAKAISHSSPDDRAKINHLTVKIVP